MITVLFASLVPALPCPAPAALRPAVDDAPVPLAAALQDEGSGDAEFDKQLAEAGDDVEKLWALAQAMREQDKRDLSKIALRKLIEVSPDHEEGRKALGHRQYDGKWFESYSALSKYRREEEKRMLEEEGLVRFNDGWARPEDIPYLRMGWLKDDTLGRWVNPYEADQRKERARLESEGWKQREDSTWASPEDLPKWDQGLWKCGEEWVDLEKANEYHANLGTWWELIGEHFVTLGTVPRTDGWGLDWARWWADQCYPDLVRALGVEPPEKPSLLVLRDLQQYNTFAAGDQAQQLPPTEISGSSSVHYSYFAEAWVDISVQPPQYRGVGVCYWNIEDPNLAPYGQYAVRHAAAHSYMEAIDPSWDTISQAFQNPQNLQVATFWNEKRIPRWLRYGIASYCERFSKDPSAVEGGDPWGIRAWALQNLRAGGELDPLEQVFAMTIDANDANGSVRRIHQAGLIVAFLLDGDCEPARKAHEDFKSALAGGADTGEAAQALQQAVVDNLDALKAFAKF